MIINFEKPTKRAFTSAARSVFAKLVHRSEQFPGGSSTQQIFEMEHSLSRAKFDAAIAELDDIGIISLSSDGGWMAVSVEPILTAATPAEWTTHDSATDLAESIIRASGTPSAPLTQGVANLLRSGAEFQSPSIRPPVAAADKARQMGLAPGAKVRIGGDWVWTFVGAVNGSVRVTRGGQGERWVSDGHDLELA